MSPEDKNAERTTQTVEADLIAYLGVGTIEEAWAVLGGTLDAE
jgi:hypothetical protein